LLDIELVGAEKFIKAGLEANVIFIAPPSIEELRSRLEKRGTEKADVVEKRIQIAKDEIEQAKTKEFVSAILLNDDFEVFYQRALEVLKKMYSHLPY
jgi:guanylate kinase